MKKFTTEVMRHLLHAGKTDRPSKFADPKKYIGTSHEFIGLSMTAQKNVFKTAFSFANLSSIEQLKTWDHLWNSAGHYELMNLALMFADRHFASFEPAALWDVTRHWVKKTDNWAHSDGLSSIYARILEAEPEQVYAQYIKWNASANPWERRQSVVGLLYYSKMRKKILPFPKLQDMVVPLLNDENYFVQKGVGWTLREMGNAYPAKTLSFLKKHITDIRPPAFTAAIEKLGSDQKDALKKMRKKNPRGKK